jgi:hypothetical protein
VYFTNIRIHDLLTDKLRYPDSTVNVKWWDRMVKMDNAHIAAIVSINHPTPYTYMMAQGQSGSRGTSSVAAWRQQYG